MPFDFFFFLDIKSRYQNKSSQVHVLLKILLDYFLKIFFFIKYKFFKLVRCLFLVTDEGGFMSCRLILGDTYICYSVIPASVQQKTFDLAGHEASGGQYPYKDVR